MTGRSYDVAIVGAGAAGLYSFYCARVGGLRAGLFDSLETFGGQCTHLYPSKQVYGVPGFGNIDACGFVSELASQAIERVDDVWLNTKIGEIRNLGNHFELRTGHGVCADARFVILATGIGEMIPNYPRGVENLESLKASGFVMHHCMNVEQFKNKTVVVAGGGDSAADFALQISKIAKQVYLVHRRANLSCENAKTERLKISGNIELKLSANIARVEQNVVHLDDWQIPCDNIIFCYGFVANTSKIDGVDLSIKNNLIEVDVNNMQTSADRIFAVGDGVTYANKKKNLVSCFFEADRAIRSIIASGAN